MWNWDYDLKKNWQPKTAGEWEWYLTRLINYGLGKRRLNPTTLRKYLPNLKIDPYKKKYLEYILQRRK